MEAFTILAILLAYLTAASLKGVTGIGFSTISMGLLASMVDLKLAIPLVIIPSVSSNILVMIQAGRFTETLRRFRYVFLSVIPGVLIGLWILGSVDSRFASMVLGVVLCVYGIWGLRNIAFALPARLEKLLAAPVGFVTGIINGVTGSQVMPILPYLLALRVDKEVFVQACNISFTLSSAIMMAGLWKLDLVNSTVLWISAAGIIPAALGINLGGRLRQRLSEERFHKLVLILLIGLGLNLALRG